MATAKSHAATATANSQLPVIPAAPKEPLGWKILSDTLKGKVIDKAVHVKLLFDCKDGNPNGDPNRGNEPRTDPATGIGLVTPECIWARVKEAVHQIMGGLPGFDMYIKNKSAPPTDRVKANLNAQAWEALGLEAKVWIKGSAAAPEAPADPDEEAADGDEPATGRRGRKGPPIDYAAEFGNVVLAGRYMASRFFDVRDKGGVMGLAGKNRNCGQLRGPLQIGFARSIDVVRPERVQITCRSVGSQAEYDKDVEKNGTLSGTFGDKWVVPYGLYEVGLYVNPYLALGENGTGMTWYDLEVILQVLAGPVWELTRSAARPEMATRGLYAFAHELALGSAPAHKLFEKIAVTPLGRPANSWVDYDGKITVDEAMPAGVRLTRVVG